MMKKGIIYNLFCAAAMLAGCTACSEFQMQKFEQAPAVNFAGFDKLENPSDDPAALKASLNFGPMMDFQLQDDTLTVLVKLEGMLSDKPLRVALKLTPVENAPLPELILPDELYIGAKSTQTTLRVVVPRPVMMDTVYKAKLEFDYANSDVEAGAKERQSYAFAISDELTFEMLKITEAKWESYFVSRVGVFGPMKVRFITSFLKRLDLSAGLPSMVLKDIRAALKKYNDAHPGNPLREPDGTLVSCDPA